MSNLAKRVTSQYKLAMAVLVLMFAGIMALTGHAEAGYAAITLFSIAVAVSLLLGMVYDIMHGRYGVDILAVVAIGSTLAVGEYWATIVIVLMMTSGEALEKYANNRARAELSALLARAPKIAHKHMVDGSIRDIPIDEIGRGDVLLVRPGEVIPVDAVVTDGVSTLDESSITGESEPVEVAKGSEILSGAINGGSPLTIKTTHIASDSQYEQIVQLVKAASEAQAPFVRLADRYAVPFTLIAFIIAGIAWAVSGDAKRFAEVLVVATPCPLLLAAPIALISGMSRSSKHGIIVKNGGILERLSTVRTAAFDKTGTLTNGLLAIDGIAPASKSTEHDVLQIAASAERTSGHVTALALVEEAKRRGIALLDTTKVVEVPGDGVTCKIGRSIVVAGKRELLIKKGVKADTIPEHHQTATYVAKGKKYLGVVTYADTVREDSAETLSQLKTLGVENLLMITGDHQEPAERIAAQLGITEVYASCLPKDKLEIVRNYAQRPVMMTGDGVNDAPVLAVSDVGVAMGARGATAASESADVVIMVDEISRVSVAIDIAKHTIRIAKQSVIAGIVISILLMLVAATGVIPAVIGAMLQEVVDIVVILNALRAHSDKLLTSGE